MVLATIAITKDTCSVYLLTFYITAAFHKAYMRTFIYSRVMYTTNKYAHMRVHALCEMQSILEKRWIGGFFKLPFVNVFDI